VLPVTAGASVEDYQAVILGSAVQGAHWLPEAVDFARDHQATLARLPVALFSVHFFARGDGAKSESRRLTYLDAVRPFVPTDTVAFFAGRFDQRTVAHSGPRWLARLTPTLDYRDWDKIRAWAQTVFA
jgi:menaquinone-dependent protoporphyrinogen oxidase